jgi:hypothetical protein
MPCDAPVTSATRPSTPAMNVLLREARIINTAARKRRAWDGEVGTREILIKWKELFLRG